MIECANCGTDNPADATFCQTCSHFLAWEAPPGSIRPARSASTPPDSPEEKGEPLEPQTPTEDGESAELSGPPEITEGATEEPAGELDAALQPEPEREPVEVAPESGSLGPATEPGALASALDSIHTAQRLAAARDRGDLASHLHRAEEQITRRSISIAVVGEFKRGKSTLINALLRTQVCPVDADIVTAVPTIVRYGDVAGATAFLEPAKEGDEPETQSIGLDDIASYVSEAGNPGNRRRLRTVEVRLPHPLLRSGLCLVDTPGVGGLDSAHGIVTLSALIQAQGLVFLTDASQELTGPELDFLKSALERCPVAGCVVTKTDLYLEWPRIVELNRSHLRDAGLDLPIMPVSSFLRLGSDADENLLAESGFPALVDFILGTVVAADEARTANVATNEVEFVAAQLDDQLSAEKHVLETPEDADKVVARLDQARRTAKTLTSPASTWQQMLTDGIQDLVAEVEFDLQERLRTVMRDADAIIDEGDPKETWPDLEVWLRRQAVAAAVDNYDQMSTLADELTEEVAAAFDMVSAQVSSARPGTHSDSVGQIRIAEAGTLENPAGKLAPMLLAGRTATLLPMLLMGTLGHLLLPVIAPVALFLAAGIGQKVIRDERKRQVAFRRQQAKQAARRYVDEVAFMVGKDSRDALRDTQRRLRDDFQTRALALQRSSEVTLNSVRAALELPPEARRAQAAELSRQSAEVRALRRRRPSPAEAALSRG